MAVKETLAIGFAVVGLAVGANEALSPSTPQDSRQQHQQQQVGDLADSQDRDRDRWRDQSRDHIDTENRQKLTPAEHRPPEGPRIRLRIP